MKNIQLGTKMIGGFIITALIVIVVGVTAMYEQNELYKKTEILSQEAVPAVENILIVKSQAAHVASLMRSLLTPFSSGEQRHEAHEKLLEARKIYGAAKERFASLHFFESVGPEWSDLNESISKWIKANNRAVDLSERLVKEDLTVPTVLRNHMNEFEIGHHRLLANIGKLIAFNIPFTGGTDSTHCALGTWLEEMDTTNQQIKEIAAQLKPVHIQFHDTVKQIKDLVQDDKIVEARAVTKEKLYPLADQLFALVKQMKNIADSAYNSFTEMNDLLLNQAADHQANTFAAMDAIIVKAEEFAYKTMKEGEHIANTGRIINIVGITLGTIFALILGFYLTFSIKTPLTKGVILAKAMADGDMTQTMDVDQNDEIGVLAKSLNSMTTGLRAMIKDISQGVTAMDSSSSELAAIADQVNAGTEDTAARSSQVAAATEEMSANQNTVAAAMEQAAVNMNMVATAAGEMNATITEIAQNSGRAKEITTMAVEQSQEASDRVDELGRAANEINKVTEAITEISEQTNLLALNATIEAARAGEAGKGFAVVANEIKDLAKQTAEATQDIKTKIQGIQQATGITVKEINEISAIITDVDQIVSSIATAVEEQTATTREIAENVNQASLGINEVNENVTQSSSVAAEVAQDIAEVNTSANKMNTASSQVKEKAQDLAVIADKLKDMVARFTV